MDSPESLDSRLRSSSLSLGPSKTPPGGPRRCRFGRWTARSLQSLPLAAGRLPLSRQPGSLAVIHRCAGTHNSSLSPPVSPTPDAFTPVVWFPRRLWVPFPHAEARFPVSLGLVPAEPPRSASFTCFEASLPPASPFATRSGFPSPAGRYSPGILPL
jgi:hypothetical protein